jgi:hypothetical protein
MIGMPPSPRWPAVSVALLLLLSSGSAFSVESAEPAEPDAAEEQVQVDPLDEARAVRRLGNVEGVASQARIDELSDETETLFAHYSNTLRQIDSIRIYNHQLRELITSQEAELASLQDQLDRVEVVGRSVTPLMYRMIDALDALVELDLPYLLEERSERIAELRKLMTRADVTSAEKYRRIMEAYQTENEYGRTIEAYRSTLRRGERDVKVDFLRFGRIALVYQTLDGMEAGVWNQAEKAWEPLDASYRTAIRQGLRIARKQAAPDLIRLPLPVPAGGRS